MSRSIESHPDAKIPYIGPYHADPLFYRRMNIISYGPYNQAVLRFVAHEETAEAAAQAAAREGGSSNGVHWWGPDMDKVLGPPCAKCGKRFCAMLLDGGNWRCDQPDCQAIWHVCGDGNVVYGSEVGPEFCPNCTEESKRMVRCHTGGGPPSAHCNTCKLLAMTSGMWGMRYTID